jgi:quercetin dioxygenase-like cupin family protein
VSGVGASPQVVTAAEPLWFLGTLARIKLDGSQTAGRLGLFDGLLPHGAAPPLHSHPQDESFYLIEGRVTAWVVADAARVADGSWVEDGQACGSGAVAYAPAGVPHTFRVESDTARMLFLSTPAGVEEYVRGLAEPAGWPWLQPPADGPRVPPERLEEVERAVGVVRHGPPPPRAIV